jgi:hypothetical protein
MEQVYRNVTCPRFLKALWAHFENKTKSQIQPLLLSGCNLSS